jgi:hypothetical protein
VEEEEEATVKERRGGGARLRKCLSRGVCRGGRGSCCGGEERRGVEAVEERRGGEETSNMRKPLSIDMFLSLLLIGQVQSRARLSIAAALQVAADAKIVEAAEEGAPAANGTATH